MPFDLSTVVHANEQNTQIQPQDWPSLSLVADMRQEPPLVAHHPPLPGTRISGQVHSEQPERLREPGRPALFMHHFGVPPWNVLPAPDMPDGRNIQQEQIHFANTPVASELQYAIRVVQVYPSLSPKQYLHQLHILRI